MSYRFFEIRGDVPEDFKEADELCRDLVNIEYAMVRGEDGRFFLGLKYAINYLRQFGIEEVSHPVLKQNLVEVLENTE